MMAKSNSFAWSSRRVERRKAVIVKLLSSFRKRKVSFPSITALAMVLAERLTDLEAKEGGQCSNVHHSTLLRRTSGYYNLLSSYMHEMAVVVGDSTQLRFSPEFVRVVSAKDLEIKGLKAQLNTMESKLLYALGKNDSSTSPLKGRGCFDTPCRDNAMGEVAKLFFDMLVGTEIYKFDLETGDLLHAGRSRNVALSGRSIGVFLNWLAGQKQFDVK